MINQLIFRLCGAMADLFFSEGRNSSSVKMLTLTGTMPDTLNPACMLLGVMALNYINFIIMHV